MYFQQAGLRVQDELLLQLAIRPLIDQAFHELESGKVNQKDLAFITKLSKEPEEYKNENDRMKVLAKMSGAQKGDTVCWYETLSEMKSTYSIKPENLNLEKYKRILLSKLNGILEITGLNIDSKISIIESYDEIC